jgi:TPR repeat protein
MEENECMIVTYSPGENKGQQGEKRKREDSEEKEKKTETKKAKVEEILPVSLEDLPSEMKEHIFSYVCADPQGVKAWVPLMGTAKWTRNILKDKVFLNTQVFPFLSGKFLPLDDREHKTHYKLRVFDLGKKVKRLRSLGEDKKLEKFYKEMLRANDNKYFFHPYLIAQILPLVFPNTREYEDDEDFYQKIKAVTFTLGATLGTKTKEGKSTVHLRNAWEKISFFFSPSLSPLSGWKYLHQNPQGMKVEGILMEDAFRPGPVKYAGEALHNDLIDQLNKTNYPTWLFRSMGAYLSFKEREGAGKLLRYVADKGNKVDLYNYAKFCLKADIDMEIYKDYLNRAAEKGHRGAQYDLALLYLKGREWIEIDEEKALEWFIKAAEQGHKGAREVVGLCCSHGQSVKKDEPKAVMDMEKEAEGHREGYKRVKGEENQKDPRLVGAPEKSREMVDESQEDDSISGPLDLLPLEIKEHIFSYVCGDLQGVKGWIPLMCSVRGAREVLKNETFLNTQVFPFLSRKFLPFNAERHPTPYKLRVFDLGKKVKGLSSLGDDRKIGELYKKMFLNNDNIYFFHPYLMAKIRPSVFLTTIRKMWSATTPQIYSAQVSHFYYQVGLVASILKTTLKTKRKEGKDTAHLKKALKKLQFFLSCDPVRCTKLDLADEAKAPESLMGSALQATTLEYAQPYELEHVRGVLPNNLIDQIKENPIWRKRFIAAYLSMDPKEEAGELLRHVADQGNKIDLYNYAKFCLKAGIDGKIYKDYLKRAAKKGHIGAQYELGICYFNGFGVEKNDIKAIEWAQKAAAEGHSLALLNQAYHYFNGLGVEKNLEKAAAPVQTLSLETREESLKGVRMPETHPFYLWFMSVPFKEGSSQENKEDSEKEKEV